MVWVWADYWLFKRGILYFKWTNKSSAISRNYLIIFNESFTEKFQYVMLNRSSYSSYDVCSILFEARINKRYQCRRQKQLLVFHVCLGIQLIILGKVPSSALFLLSHRIRNMVQCYFVSVKGKNIQIDAWITRLILKLKY